jgi:hypothetical protein
MLVPHFPFLRKKIFKKKKKHVPEADSLGMPLSLAT